MKLRKKYKQIPYRYRYHTDGYGYLSMSHLPRKRGFLTFAPKYPVFTGYDHDRRRFIVTPAGDLAPKRKIRGTWRWYEYLHTFSSNYDLKFFRWRYR